MTPAQVDSYTENGYEIFPQVFRQELIDALAQTLRRCLLKDYSQGAGLSLNDLILAREAEDHSLIYKASQSVGSSAAAYRLLGSGILEKVCALTGFDLADLHLMPMYLIIQLPGNENFDYGWHQDGAYYDWCRDFAALWFPINRPVGAGSGTIGVIPQSHVDGRRETNTHFRNGFFRQIDSRLHEGEAVGEHVLEMEPGDCCLMHGNLVHRSVPNRSATPRVAAVMRLAHLDPSTPYERERFYCVHKS